MEEKELTYEEIVEICTKNVDVGFGKEIKLNVLIHIGVFTD